MLSYAIECMVTQVWKELEHTGQHTILNIKHKIMIKIICNSEPVSNNCHYIDMIHRTRLKLRGLDTEGSNCRPIVLFNIHDR